MIEKNVSVIIPSYNRSHVLKKTIPSYIQEVTLEVIVVDDGSTDETRAEIEKLHKKYKEIKYICFNGHRGLPYAKNAGIRKAKGKYVFFGDDDAVLYGGTLYRLRNALEKFPADIAGANGSYAAYSWQIRNLDRYIAQYFTKPFHTKCIADFNTGNFIYNYKIEKVTEGLYVMAPFMIRTDVAKKMKYDTGYIKNAAREDMDYLIRQAKMGRRMVYVPDTYEIDLPRTSVNGGGSHSVKPWKNNLYTIRNNNYFLDKHYDYLKEQGYISVTKGKAKWNFGKLVLKSYMRQCIKGLLK